jgi:hypothetical protein
MSHFYWVLLGNSWRDFISSLGSTTLGFLVPFIVLPLVGLLLALFVTLVREGPRGIMTHLQKTFAFAAIAAVFGEVIVYLAIFGGSMVRANYQDHRTLSDQNRSLTSQLETHNRGITQSDPAYMGLVQILRAFQSYGSRVKGQPCTIYFTATEDSRAIAQAIAETSALVSGCHTFGPDAPMMPECSSNENEGMIPGAIVVHTSRSSGYSPAGVFQRELGNLLPTRLSYVQPRNVCFPITGRLMWLQFGTGVGWKQ